MVKQRRRLEDEDDIRIKKMMRCDQDGVENVIDDDDEDVDDNGDDGAEEERTGPEFSDKEMNSLYKCFEYLRLFLWHVCFVQVIAIQLQTHVVSSENLLERMEYSHLKHTKSQSRNLKSRTLDLYIV